MAPLILLASLAFGQELRRPEMPANCGDPAPMGIRGEPGVWMPECRYRFHVDVAYYGLALERQAAIRDEEIKMLLETIEQNKPPRLDFKDGVLVGGGLTAATITALAILLR